MHDIHKIHSILKSLYPDALCSLSYHGDPWRLLVMARLSAQCTDARVNQVSAPLFERYPDIESMASADIRELEEIVRPCGLYHTKAESLIASAKMLLADFGGKVPDNLDDLLRLPGVGRKIANLVLGDVFGKPAIVPDTHCIRINGRLGFYDQNLRDPLKVERILSEIVPRAEQGDYCHRMVLFGREYCTARSPRCGECPLADECGFSASANPENIRFELPSPVRFALDSLNKSGYSAYIVGGSVRDFVMRRAPGDFDVTTSAKPEEVIGVFRDCRIVETGLKHGTVTLVRDGMNIEITTYRIDGDYSDGRHPNAVQFTDNLALDLERRDFTINAMAYSSRTGIVDLNNGMRDIASRTISCVGNAVDRFREDGLRILRALRFSSTLDFTPDDECRSAVFSETALLSAISRERIFQELTKLLRGAAAPRILSDYSSVVAFVIPELDEQAPKFTAEAITAAREFASSVIPNYSIPAELYYSFLFSFLDGAKLQSAVASLKTSRDFSKNIKSISAGISDVLGKYRSDASAARALLGQHGADLSYAVILYSYSIKKISRDAAKKLINAVDEAAKNHDCCKISDLELSGNDLISAGLKPAEIGNCLRALLDLVINDELENKKSHLLAFAADHISDNGELQI